MREEDKLTGSHHKELFRDNDFRLVWYDRAAGNLIVQHLCPEVQWIEFNVQQFDWGKWRYCWQRERTCSRCNKSVPDAVTGMLILTGWQR